MANFEKWDKAFRNQNLFEFNFNENALMWLKVRAVCRGKLIQQFLKFDVFKNCRTKCRIV